MKIKKNKGFTIVELVIVIAVIGILSAILIPTFANLVNDAQKTALQANLRNAYTEYAGYAAAQDGFLSQEEVAFDVDDKVYVFENGKYYEATEGSYTTSDGARTYTVGDAITITVDDEEISSFNGYTAKQVSIAEI